MPQYVETSPKTRSDETLLDPSEEAIPSMSFGDSFSEIFRSFGKLLKNGPFMAITLATTSEFASCKGLCVFMPKYLTEVTGLTPSMSAILWGSTIIPGVVIGVTLGSNLVKRLKLTQLGCCKVTVIGAILSFCCFVPIMYFGCPGNALMGVAGSMPGTCSSSCRCPEIFSPVHSGNTDFLNACYAGCKTSTNGTTFTNCACMPGNSAVRGKTPKKCNPLIIVTFIFLALVAISVGHTPGLMAAMQSMDSSLKPMALGVQFILYKALAYIPAPVVLGTVIDTTCIFQKRGKCGSKGACEAYDSVKFHRYFFGFSVVFKALTVLLLIVACVLVKRRQTR